MKRRAVVLAVVLGIAVIGVSSPFLFSMQYFWETDGYDDHPEILFENHWFLSVDRLRLVNADGITAYTVYTDYSVEISPGEHPSVKVGYHPFDVNVDGEVNVDITPVYEYLEGKWHFVKDDTP